MKFRAVIREDNYMHEFIAILSTLAKMEKHVVFNLKKDVMTLFICCEDFDTNPILWVEVSGSIYFTNYTFSHGPAEYEEIYFLIDSTKMLHTFTGLQRATNQFKMKLSNHPWECFVIQTEIPGQSTIERKIELPIFIIPKRHWADYYLPTNQTYDMTVKVHNLKNICATINSFKNLSPEITVTINQVSTLGTLSFSISSILFETKSKFSNLTVKNYMTPSNPDASQVDDEQLAETSCKISSKRIASILTNNAFKHATAEISIKKDHLIKIEFEIRRKVILHYLLPAMYKDEN